MMNFGALILRGYSDVVAKQIIEAQRPGQLATLKYGRQVNRRPRWLPVVSDRGLAAKSFTDIVTSLIGRA